MAHLKGQFSYEEVVQNTAQAPTVTHKPTRTLLQCFTVKRL